MNRLPRIACLGLASWDDLVVVDMYPERGGCAIVERAAALPGGTTTNTAVALAAQFGIASCRELVSSAG